MTEDLAMKRVSAKFVPKLLTAYNNCIVLQGGYVEKCYVKLLTVTSIKTVKRILPSLFDSPS